MMYPGSLKDVQFIYNDNDTLFHLFFSEFKASWKFRIAELWIPLNLYDYFQNTISTLQENPSIDW